MIRSISRHWWIGLLGLVWFGMTEEGRAWDNPLVRVSNVRFKFDVEMSTTPRVPPPTAPWYAYFPADPRVLPSPQVSPFPSWPMQYPPQGPPSVPNRGVPMRTGAANAPQGPMQTQYWPSYPAYGSNILPVAYTPTQAPSYWYQGR